MTVAVVVKVHDGLVLATDSATTLTSVDEEGQSSYAVYYTAERVVQLHRQLPISLLTWGSGNVGSASVPTLARDLRERFSHGKRSWQLDPNDYSLEWVAERVREYFFEEKAEEVQAAGGGRVELGMCVAGYSAEAPLPELWEIVIEGRSCASPKLVGAPEQSGLQWFGHSEPIRRLVLGVSNTLRPALLASGVSPTEIGQVVQSVKDHSEVLFAPAPMPIPDAIELAEFLVSVAIQFSRFGPGRAAMGGPTQMAAITKHQGFKWVRRSHYYDPEFNPDVRLDLDDVPPANLTSQVVRRRKQRRR